MGGEPRNEILQNKMEKNILFDNFLCVRRRDEPDLVTRISLEEKALSNGFVHIFDPT